MYLVAAEVAFGPFPVRAKVDSSVNVDIQFEGHLCRCVGWLPPNMPKKAVAPMRNGVADVIETGAL